MGGGKSETIRQSIPTKLNMNNRHIMTGIGAYFYITWGIWLRHCLNGRQEEYALVWPHLISLPEIVKAPDADGVSKKTGQKKTA